MSAKDDGGDFELPNWREANRQIREEKRRERDKEKQRKKGIGGLRSLAERAERRYRNDPKKQLAWIKQNGGGIHAAIGVARLVGVKREEDLFDGFGRCLEKVREAGGRCSNLSEFSRKHFLMVMKVLEKREYEESTVEQYVCVMRRMCNLMGKVGVVPEGAELVRLLHGNGISAGTLGRQYVAEFALGWRDMGFDIDALIAQIEAYDPLAAMWFKLMKAFGLRVREVVCLQPLVSWKKTFLHVFRGTKGGKRRDVPLFKDPVRRAEQEAVIAEAIEFARKHRKGEMGVPGATLMQSLERVRWICRKFGITKTALGIVPHGLRHQFGCDLFTDECGLPAPVLRKLPPEAYAARVTDVQRAMQYVSRALGHERPHVSSAYTGSVGKLTRQERRLRVLLDQLARAGAIFVQCGVEEAWIVGHHATGIDPRKAGPLLLDVRFVASQRANAVELLSQLGRGMSEIIGLPTHVGVTTQRPENGVEILFGGP